MKIEFGEKLFGKKGTFGAWKTGANHAVPTETGGKWTSSCNLGLCGMTASNPTPEFIDFEQKMAIENETKMVGGISVASKPGATVTFKCRYSSNIQARV